MTTKDTIQKVMASSHTILTYVPIARVYSIKHFIPYIDYYMSHIVFAIHIDTPP